MSSRAHHEIEHGRALAAQDTETVWGWGTPAGAVRAQRRASLIVQGGRLGVGVRVLEIGCGTGFFTEKFASTGAQIVAVDISEDLLRRADARGLPATQVRFVAADFGDCRLQGPFDAVIGSSVLHHLDLGRALPRIHELLKPGGRMCFAEPNLCNPQVAIERLFRGWFPHVSPDESAFLRWRLRGMLRAAGFDAVEITPFDWLHPWTPEQMIPVTSVIGLWLERLPVLREFAGSLWIRARHP